MIEPFEISEDEQKRIKSLPPREQVKEFIRIGRDHEMSDDDIRRDLYAVADDLEEDLVFLRESYETLKRDLEQAKDDVQYTNLLRRELIIAAGDLANGVDRSE